MMVLALLFLCAALAQAQSLIDASSFGHRDKVSPNGWEVPGWHISGEGQVPELLSDKIILTPSYPGNIRGAAWSETSVKDGDWTAEIEFRASGPDRGSGNLQIWYAREGRSNVGTSSLYTIEKFEGLVLVVDQYGGQGGSIRGFMNDGNVNFKNHYALDSLAFGHCDFSFRNLGRPIKLQIRQEPEVFEVIVDNKLCFASDKIRLPTDYNFGITAGSAETPDSFEIYKFQLWSLGFTAQSQIRQPPSYGQQQSSDNQASFYKASESQFEDLTKKISSLSQVVEKLEREISNMQRDAETRHREVTRGLITSDTLRTFNSQSEKLDRLERLTSSFQSQFSGLHSAFKDSHESLTEGLPKNIGNLITANAPRMGMLIFIFVAIQVVLYGLYTVYKRRSKQGPKKYL